MFNLKYPDLSNAKVYDNLQSYDLAFGPRRLSHMQRDLALSKYSSGDADMANRY